MQSNSQIRTNKLKTNLPCASAGNMNPKLYTLKQINTVGYSHPSDLEVMIIPMKYLPLKNLFCGRKFCFI